MMRSLTTQWVAYRRERGGWEEKKMVDASHACCWWRILPKIAKKEILQSRMSERHLHIPSLVAATPKIYKSETVLVGE